MPPKKKSTHITYAVIAPFLDKLLSLIKNPTDLDLRNIVFEETKTLPASYFESLIDMLILIEKKTGAYSKPIILFFFELPECCSDIVELAIKKTPPAFFFHHDNDMQYNLFNSYCRRIINANETRPHYLHLLSIILQTLFQKNADKKVFAEFFMNMLCLYEICFEMPAYQDIFIRTLKAINAEDLLIPYTASGLKVSYYLVFEKILFVISFLHFTDFNKEVLQIILSKMPHALWDGKIARHEKIFLTFFNSILKRTDYKPYREELLLLFFSKLEGKDWCITKVTTESICELMLSLLNRDASERPHYFPFTPLSCLLNIAVCVSFDDFFQKLFYLAFSKLPTEWMDEDIVFPLSSNENNTLVQLVMKSSKGYHLVFTLLIRFFYSEWENKEKFIKLFLSLLTVYLMKFKDAEWPISHTGMIENFIELSLPYKTDERIFKLLKLILSKTPANKLIFLEKVCLKDEALEELYREKMQKYAVLQEKAQEKKEKKKIGKQAHLSKETATKKQKKKKELVKAIEKTEENNNNEEWSIGTPKIVPPSFRYRLWSDELDSSVEDRLAQASVRP